MDVRRYLRLARAAWALLLAGLVLGAGVAFGVSSLLPEQYTATTQLFVSTTGADDLSAAVQGNYYAQGKVASYASLVTSKELATAVIDDLGLDATPHQVMSRLSATVVPDTTILDVTVTDDSAQGALDVARSIDTEFADLVDQLETPRGDTTSPIKITVIATPELPAGPSSPNLRANVALGAVLGLVLAVLVAVVRDRLDTTVKDDEEVTARTGAPVIGHLPVAAELSHGHPPVPHALSPAAEAVRHVRTNLAFLDVDRPPRTILLTSSVPGEGKTTLTGHLAVALAESGNRVALVEADLRRPRLTRYLGLVSGVGVTSVLTGSAQLDEVLQPVRDGALEVLGAGPLPPNPSELLASEAFATLLAELAGTHDVVLIDAPPLLPVADAGALAGLVDGVLLCAHWGKVDAEDLQRSAASLDRLGARLLGVVMTQVPHRAAPVSYGYGVQPARSRRRWAGRRTPQDPPVPVPPVRPRTAQGASLAESGGR
jgi:capsular exopolysaccharide synthesis family protein